MPVRAFLAEFQLSPPGATLWHLGAVAWIIFALPLCLAGLGLLARRWLGPLKPELLPIVGLGIFIFAGGVLNLLHVAFTCSIWIVLAFGFLNWSHSAWQYCSPLLKGRSSSLRSNPEILLLGVLAAGVVALTASSQISPAVFNWRDDLQKYFAHPVRMLETGTVFGSPLSAMGLESLGGMAFVHATSLVCLPLPALNGVDAVLGLVLCLVPLFGFGARHPALRAVAALAMASVAIIDPYYVNTSALFLAAALMMGTVFLSGETADASANPKIIGLIYAGLISLKTVFVLFAVPHLVLLALAGCAFDSPRAAAKRALLTCAWTGAFIAPWIAVHLPHYLSQAATHSQGSPAALRHVVDLWGTEATTMGITGLRAYTVLSLVTGVLVLLCLGIFPSIGRGAVRRPGTAAAGAVAVAAYPFMIYGLPRILGYADADSVPVRYCIPIFLGVFPAVLCSSATCVFEGCPGLAPNARMGICFALGAAALVPFSGTAAQRFRDAARFGTFLPFPVAHEPGLAAEMKYALGREKMESFRSLQQMMPSGASVIAWINTPYLLDYSRNTVFDAEAAGIGARWAVPPDSDYILWEYRGSASPQERTRRLIASLPDMDARLVVPLIDFDRILWARVQAGTVVFKNEEFILVRSAGR